MMLRRLCERMTNGEVRDQLMNSEWLRFESFKSCPDSLPISSCKLAKNGLYYIGNGQNDSVKCFSCNIILSGWCEFDEPADRHEQRSPDCDFVRGTDGNNIPIHAHTLGSNPDSSLQNSDVAVEGTVGASGGVPQDLGMGQYTRENPKFAQFRCSSDRFRSYKDVWTKEEVVRSDILADAGFFNTGVGDLVRCFQCGIGLRNWGAGDDPWIEHAKVYKWCKYLEDEKGKDFIQEHSEQEPTDDFENHIGSGSDRQEAEQNQAGSKGCDEKREAGGNQKPEEYSDLKSENERLKSTVMCKICLTDEVNVLFLPCGHLVSCQTCAPHVTQCAVCRMQIENRRKIFLA